ncbi:hypothetical protein EDD21DRAFT_388020 [Dissophora ornata]|nr:hypothetical protein EDD21DRAFT_388020 [Dissophora ornata]
MGGFARPTMLGGRRGAGTGVGASDGLLGEGGVSSCRGGSKGTGRSGLGREVMEGGRGGVERGVEWVWEGSLTAVDGVGAGGGGGRVRLGGVTVVGEVGGKGAGAVGIGLRGGTGVAVGSAEGRGGGGGRERRGTAKWSLFGRGAGVGASWPCEEEEEEEELYMVVARGAVRVLEERLMVGWMGDNEVCGAAELEGAGSVWGRRNEDAGMKMVE